MNLRILHWYPNFLGGGGVTNAVLGLAEAQAGLGAKVSICAVESSATPLYGKLKVADAVKLITWLPSWSVRVPASSVRWVPAEAAAHMQRFSPDIVHIHGEFNPDNLWVPRLFRSTIVHSPHGSFNSAVMRKSHSGIKQIYVAIAKMLLYRKVGAFHGASPTETKYISDLLPDVNTYTVQGGPNPRVNVSCTISKDGNSSGTEELKFLVVGRLDIFQKGLDILLDAYSQALKSLVGHACSLTVVGPDWNGGRAVLENRVRELGISNSVKFVGPSSSRKVGELYSEADIYVQLSRYEGCSTTCLEALQAGKPAILSNETGVASFPQIEELPHVRIVSPNATEAAKAIVELAGNLDELAPSALKHWEEIGEFFSWHQAAKLHCGWYTELIRNATKP